MTRGDAVALAAAGLFTGAASLAGAATNGPPLRVVAVAAAQETVNADLAQRGAKLNIDPVPATGSSHFYITSP